MVDDVRLSDERLIKAELRLDYLQDDFKKVLEELKILNANMSELIAIKKDVDSIAEKQRNFEEEFILHIKEEFKPLSKAVSRNTYVVVIVSTLAGIAASQFINTSINMLITSGGN